MTGSEDVRVDVLVIGAGQAGLGTGLHLARRTSLSFLLVDGAGRLGDSWRRRWDSLVLFTPRGFSSLPGTAIPRGPGEYATKDEAADYLDRYAARERLPVRLRTRVLAVAGDDAGRFVAERTTGWIRAGGSGSPASSTARAPAGSRGWSGPAATGSSAATCRTSLSQGRSGCTVSARCRAVPGRRAPLGRAAVADPLNSGIVDGVDRDARDAVRRIAAERARSVAAAAVHDRPVAPGTAAPPGTLSSHPAPTAGEAA